VDAWNTWYDWFGNTPEGFASGNRTIDEACERAGRDPASVERSACVLVRFPDGAGERPDEPGIRPAGVADALLAFADAGAHEVILVLDPITEASIRELGAELRG
jgi:alkanesulfonate monooxygenase SsuD/methylene tetrahydromethanopterin reductase-like flavin-dependent oxidoreductase (luciferase family)